MPEDLAGKSAIIVGASSGMGRATALALAAQGMNVVVAARRDGALQSLAGEIQQLGGNAVPCRADVTRRRDVERLIDTALSDFGRIDLLVYAAGTNIPDRSLERLAPDTWDTMLATNLSGAFHCTQLVLPAMRRQGGGLIVYISSVAVGRPDVSGVAYQASKHGLSGLAMATDIEEKEHGIRTTLLFPGLTDTPILQKRPTPTPPETLRAALQPEDVAESVVFLARLPARARVPELSLVPSRL